METYEHQVDKNGPSFLLYSYSAQVIWMDCQNQKNWVVDEGIKNDLLHTKAKTLLSSRVS